MTVREARINLADHVCRQDKWLSRHTGFIMVVAWFLPRFFPPRMRRNLPRELSIVRLQLHARPLDHIAGLFVMCVYASVLGSGCQSSPFMQTVHLDEGWAEPRIALPMALHHLMASLLLPRVRRNLSKCSVPVIRRQSTWMFCAESSKSNKEAARQTGIMLFELFHILSRTPEHSC